MNLVMVQRLILQGKNVANPLATILSVAMMLRYTFRETAAKKQLKMQ